MKHVSVVCSGLPSAEVLVIMHHVGEDFRPSGDMKLLV